VNQSPPSPEEPAPRPTPAVLFAAVLLLFFVSGACTLVFQVVWVRMLVPVFGMSVFAVSTVLTVFMAGLALGSWWFGRLIDRGGRAVRVYGWLELGIGLFALAFPLVLARLDVLYTYLYRQTGGNDYVFALVRFAICFVVLLVPTTLMGGTLPVLSKFVVRGIERAGRRIGALYAVNTLGATFGCAAAAYVLLEQFGTRGTTYVAAAGNLLVAAVAFAIGRRESGVSRPASSSPKRWAKETPGEASLASPTMARAVVWAFALSGFAALGYEVVWTRLLTIVLNITTIQSVSTILISFLFGIALGSAVGSSFVDRVKALPAVFASLELILGLFGLLSVAAFSVAPAVLDRLGSLPAWTGHMLRLFSVTFVVMLVPTFLMGMLFPVASKIYLAGLQDLGRRVGTVYAANTAGAIFGAFVAGFVFIPLLGTQYTIFLLAGLNVAIGTTILLAGPRPRRAVKFAVLGGLVLPALVIAVVLPANQLVEALRASEPGSSLIFHDENTGGTVTVHGFPDGLRLLKVNGAGEVPTDRASIRTFRLLGNLPMLLHDDPQDVLVIAFGGGITLGAVDLHRPRRLDCVEVVPGVFEAARHLARYNRRIFERLDQPPIEIVVDDGRNHVLRTDRRYDVIISDSTHPGTADSWILYTEEFYRLCSRRLAPGGMMAQWLPLHGLSAEDHRTVLRTFRRVFPHATLWMTRGYTILLATPERLEIDYTRLEERLADEDVRTSLYEVDLDDAASFVSALALDEEACAEYAGSGEVNTDDRPRVSLADRSRAGTATGLSALVELIPHLVMQPDPRWRFDSDLDRQEVARRFAARALYYRADVALKLGDPRTAMRELQRARAIDPQERWAARMMQGIEAAASPSGPSP
jgi:spermidine synthase